MKSGKKFLIACMIAAGTCLYVHPTYAQTTPATSNNVSQTDYDNDNTYGYRHGASPWWGLLGLLGLFGLVRNKKIVERDINRPATTR